MSYRTYVNEFQIFGNNVYYTKWIGFIESEGIEIDDCGCYEGDITNVMGAIKILEELVLNEEQKRQEIIAEYKIKDDADEREKEIYRLYGPRSLFDFTNIPYNINKNPDSFFLLDELTQIVKDSYMFLPLSFIKACGSSIEPVHSNDDSYRFYNYKIKKGCTIHVKAS